MNTVSAEPSLREALAVINHSAQRALRLVRVPCFVGSLTTPNRAARPETAVLRASHAKRVVLDYVTSVRLAHFWSASNSLASFHVRRSLRTPFHAALHALALAVCHSLQLVALARALRFATRCLRPLAVLTSQSLAPLPLRCTLLSAACRLRSAAPAALSATQT